MALSNLSNDFVSNAVCPQNKQKATFSDTQIKGLMLEVRPTGNKTFYLRYQSKHGKSVQYKLANACDINVNQARELAARYRNEIALGKDPRKQKQKLRNTPLLKDFVKHKYLPYAKSYKRSWQTDESILRNHILPKFGNVHMDQITKQDVMEFHSKLRSSGLQPSSANRPIVLLRFIFNLALKWEVPGITGNPTLSTPLFEVNNNKERFLSQTEVKRLKVAINESQNKMLPYIIPMLLLTGARKREVLDAKWQDFDFERKNWIIPISKSGKARHVPISDGVTQLLEEVPRLENCPYVFANPKTRKPFVSIFHSWNTARKKAGLEDVRIHDLRHSCASFLVNAGVSLYVVQKILGHSQIATTQRYSHLNQDTLLDAANQVASQMALAG